ncbi:hypothetical protein BJ085DRAFT_35016 [Dimargaris cristalligena]|uniref:BLOC-1-related complex subunit 5 n=1 Tax=Dimargaris cristalligena TaxID=215637 RepID=A0A4Q0A0X1_9FUNG|nr:hypothetical protein BJ085DRAFT_35016 [Dimargaris cristalligena]|eukprot:RKP39378.1 hypothetical protein BJ085DRAFT_35016 [Dimargaris cristalligena]
MAHSNSASYAGSGLPPAPPHMGRPSRRTHTTHGLPPHPPTPRTKSLTARQRFSMIEYDKHLPAASSVSSASSFADSAGRSHTFHLQFIPEEHGSPNSTGSRLSPRTRRPSGQTDIITLFRPLSASDTQDAELDKLHHLPEFRPIFKPDVSSGLSLSNLWPASNGTSHLALEVASPMFDAIPHIFYVYRNQVQALVDDVQKEQSIILDQISKVETRSAQIFGQLHDRTAKIKAYSSSLSSVRSLSRHAEKTKAHLDHIGHLLLRLNDRLPTRGRIDFRQYEILDTLASLHPVPKPSPHHPHHLLEDKTSPKPFTVTQSSQVPAVSLTTSHPPGPSRSGNVPSTSTPSRLRNRGRTNSIIINPVFAAPRESVSLSLDHVYVGSHPASPTAPDATSTTESTRSHNPPGGDRSTPRHQYPSTHPPGTYRTDTPSSHSQIATSPSPCHTRHHRAVGPGQPQGAASLLPLPYSNSRAVSPEATPTDFTLPHNRTTPTTATSSSSPTTTLPLPLPPPRYIISATRSSTLPPQPMISSPTPSVLPPVRPSTSGNSAYTRPDPHYSSSPRSSSDVMPGSSYNASSPPSRSSRASSMSERLRKIIRSPRH